MSSSFRENDNSAINNEKDNKIPSMILLDRDGVINVDVGSPGVLSPKQLQLTPNAAKAIGQIRREYKNLKNTVCRIVIVTNQSCVGKGLISIEELHMIHDTLRQMLLHEDEDATIDQIYYCTSTNDDDNDDWRKKPNPGMIEQACREWNVRPEDAILIGDSTRDLQAAQSGGVPRRILVSTGYGLGIMEHRSPPNGHVCLVTKDDVVSSSSSLTSSHVFTAPESIPTSILPFWYAENLDVTISWLLRTCLHCA